MKNNQLWTDTGIELVNNAIMKGEKITLKHISFGNGDYTPTGKEEALKKELYKTSNFKTEIIDNKAIKITVLLKDLSKDYTFKEVGLFNDDDKLIYIGTFTEVNLPADTNNQLKDIQFNIYLLTSNTEQFELKRS